MNNMIFSCTKKVADKVRKYKEVKNEKSEINFYNWYVDIINLERKNYFLFTNSLTLFSFFIYAGTKKELMNIEELFAEKLKEQVLREIGSSEEYLKALFPKSGSTEFMKTNSRSVLGSMNDYKMQIKILVECEGELRESYHLINHRINRTPMGALKYGQPTKVMKKELEKIASISGES